MPEMIQVKTFKESRGNLSVIESFDLPFPIKRIFYIYDVDDSKRARHGHHKTIQALICLTGSCRVFCDNGSQQSTYLLESPEQCLILQPEDWHEVDQFSTGTVLLVLASENFDPEDYIFDKPQTK